MHPKQARYQLRYTRIFNCSAQDCAAKNYLKQYSIF